MTLTKYYITRLDKFVGNQILYNMFLFLYFANATTMVQHEKFLPLLVALEVGGLDLIKKTWKRYILVIYCDRFQIRKLS